MSNALESTCEDSAKATTRRNFLRLTGASVAAGAVGLASCTAQSSLPQLVEAAKIAQLQSTSQMSPIELVGEETQAAPELPWPYPELDVEMTRKLGHAGYYHGHCAYGVFSAIVDQLAEQHGYPYTQIPTEMMVFGKGGVVGWGMTCGAILGASAAIYLVAEEPDADAIINELIEWYCQTPLPSDISNQYATNHEFLVVDYKSDAELAQSVSGSPLCHISVSQWSTATGFASGSKERSERCGRLAGDVAAKAVELLNAHHGGTFMAAFEASEEAQICQGCHKKGKNYEDGNFTQGKGECLLCHEPHE